MWEKNVEFFGQTIKYKHIAYRIAYTYYKNDAIDQSDESIPQQFVNTITSNKTSYKICLILADSQKLLGIVEK